MFVHSEQALWSYCTANGTWREPPFMNSAPKLAHGLYEMLS
jgi:hypothetical protein